ncbi:hypothetical protein [Solirhodobacter olei]|uniref:hypothetical protein n=1 Tax=Solirhodobacter olei TaxID=2493082 RepID=UPI000FDB4F4C|nr:hypothetical protein [Solirhodobacter olei]
MAHLTPRSRRVGTDHRSNARVRFLAFGFGLCFALAGGSAVAGSLPGGVGLTDPTLAYGLNAISDWSTEMPFLDIAHDMRPFVAHGSGKWEVMSNKQLRDGGYLDAHGWLKRMPRGVDSVGTIWDWGDTDQSGTAAARSRAGTYILTYKGQGTIELGLGAHVISSVTGTIVFQNSTGTTMLLNITATDPKGTGDYIRDISVVKAQYEGLLKAGEIFNPDFLSVVQDARELRFKDWMALDSQTETGAWPDRPKEADATWSGQGVPVEVMVQLANQTGADPWFTMPAWASDDYIRNFATYVRDHLSQGLTAHVEYGNENWNWSYSTNARWLVDRAQSEWAETGGASWINYAAKRATETALIWDHVFGSEAKTRLDNVLGVQTAFPGLAKEELTAPIWRKHERSKYVAPYTVFNSLAVTTYFGGAFVSDPHLRAELLAAINNPNIDAKRFLTERLTDPRVKESIPQIQQYWVALRDLADQYRLRLTAYEGGQHVQHSAFVEGLSKHDLTVLSTFLENYVRSPEMARLYHQLWSAWAKVGDGPFMQFVDVAAPSKYGSWGLLSALGDKNPRAEMLRKLNRSSKSWFGDGGGQQYQQGVIKIAGDSGEVLSGTAKQDFLVGGAGNDTLIPGTGNDGINGGGGTNTLVLPGRADEYRLKPDGVGYRLTGPGVSDFALNIQRFAFDDGTTRTLAQMLK